MKYRALPVEVEAFAIISVGVPDEHGGIPITLENDTNEVATPEMCSRMRPKSGDYLVIQNDGYVYLNPRDVFLRKYESII